jgi:hypothetical protein
MEETIIIEMTVFKWESIKEYLQLTPEIDYKLITKTEENGN